MKKRNGLTKSQQCQNERGAALITTLLIATLLLGAGLSLVMSTSMSSTNAIDSTAEMQAYLGAEAGIEATLNVLRGNVAPHVTLPAGTKINFRNAANPPTSDRTSDTWRTGTGAVARLSGWLNYSYQRSANDWRVPVTSSYSPLTGIAYKIVISDPDDPGAIATRKITTNPSYKPSRLIIQSEGYGPKGAIKRLEMIIKSSAFDVPAAMTLQCGPSVDLTLGNSIDTTYSGDDMAVPPGAGKPTVATCPAGSVTAQAAIDTSVGQVTPSTAAALTGTNTPGFLATADACRAFLYDPITGMRPYASRIGRLFPNKALALAAGGLGTAISPKVTFIDNYGTTAVPGPVVDLGTGHQGSGILIVTGELSTNGNTDFEGVILVLGRGKITRFGGGDGVIRGAVVVAAFDPNGALGTGFGSSTYAITGGGESTIGFDSFWVRDALSMTGAFVVGIREYH